MSVIINIDAPDVDRAEEFYAEGLGLERVRRLFGGKLAEMRLDGQLFHILPKAEGSQAFVGGEQRHFARHWTPVHLDFVVKDLRQALARAVAAGAIAERPAASHDWGSIAGCTDPFGNGFCLIQLSEKGYS
jgi:predicted enzyme related to lactoylglutathione lyase